MKRRDRKMKIRRKMLKNRRKRSKKTNSCWNRDRWSWKRVWRSRLKRGKLIRLRKKRAKPKDKLRRDRRKRKLRRCIRVANRKLRRLGRNRNKTFLSSIILMACRRCSMLTISLCKLSLIRAVSSTAETENSVKIRLLSLGNNMAFIRRSYLDKTILTYTRIFSRKRHCKKRRRLSHRIWMTSMAQS